LLTETTSGVVVPKVTRSLQFSMRPSSNSQNADA
jgi:hypothetical protein